MKKNRVPRKMKKEMKKLWCNIECVLQVFAANCDKNTGEWIGEEDEKSNTKLTTV